VDTIIWSEGPGSENLARAMENTDVYQVMAEAMR
jgi:alkaline phosphatase